MITELDLNIYQALFQQKKNTEKYLGKVNFDWIYSEIHYTAESTVGVPFDLFDKTIVGILLVDEVLSIEEIGGILGMNVIHNPEKQQYRDDAEFDILRIALDNLYKYKMIEIGDTSYSSCRLTNIGKEYVQKGRKLKIESNKPFLLVYDHTSQNHIEAKYLFRNLKGKKQLSIINDFDFLDEVLMKQIASEQAHEIYDESKGNSFINPKIVPSKSQSFFLEIIVALLYNLENNQIRLLAYEPITKTVNKYFTEWLNENKLEEILEKYQVGNNINNIFPILPADYIKTLAIKQQLFEEEINKNLIATTVVNEVNQCLQYIDIEYFWINLNSFIVNNINEAWFFLPEYDIQHLSLIDKIAQCYPNISIFIALNSNFTLENNLIKQRDEYIEKSHSINSNLFIEQVPFKKIKKFLFWGIGDVINEIAEEDFTLTYNIKIKLLNNEIKNVKPHTYYQIKNYFAKLFLPIIKEKLLTLLSLQ